MEKILQNLKDFIFVSKYARTVGSKKETWDQAVERVMHMHNTHLNTQMDITAENMDKLKPYLNLAEIAYKEQRILGAQRALQWGGDQLLNKHMRLYNCAGSPADRLKFFGETMWILLAGAGVGYSVQKKHVAKLPELKLKQWKGTRRFLAEDSIEGWADSTQAIVNSYFDDDERIVEVDYSAIRPKGSMISGGFRAPGPEPLKKAHKQMRAILDKAKGRQLRPIEVHDLVCIIADAVVSGGVRRSALLSMFSVDDEEMMKAKTNSWFLTAPWRGRANNSAVILPSTTKEQYDKLFSMTKEYGEPGFLFLENENIVLNPCVEVGMYPYYDGQSGWSFCNLTEVNGKKVETMDDFLYAVNAAAILGTVQATYTKFDYLTETTKKIVERDALIGVGITGMAENPGLLFNKGVLTVGAEKVKEVNTYIAKLLGINPAARTTVIKPSGNSAQLLGTSSGVHPFHSKRYIRNVQINKDEQVADVIRIQAPDMIEQSVWNDNDWVASFPIDLTNKEEIILTKEDLTAIEFLDMVKDVYEGWIVPGTNIEHPAYDPHLTHNVSNTVTVQPNEWTEVREYLWKNKDFFTGVSLLSDKGDLDYPQAPFVEVLDEVELAEEYGVASILAGGLVVDGIHAFGNLWLAIDTALGKGEKLEVSKQQLLDIIDKGTDDYCVQFEYKIGGLKLTDVNSILASLHNKNNEKREWVDRFERFASKYLGGDLETTGHCLKHVSTFHKWNKLLLSPLISWNAVDWAEKIVDAGAEVATACAGGACEI